MWIIYCTGIIAILGLLFYNANKKKTNITRRFAVLLPLLFTLDKHLQAEEELEESVTLFASNVDDTITIYLRQHSDIISIIIETIKEDDFFHKNEWFFLENMNQQLIFNQILNDLLEDEKTDVKNQKKYKKLLDQSNMVTNGVTLSGIFSSENKVSAAFCIAHRSILPLSRQMHISDRGMFEILFFNCVTAFEKLDPLKNDSSLWGNFIDLLIFYLENQNLMNQIPDMDGLFEHRFGLYSQHLQLIKTTPHYDYNVLAHYFFVKPLSLKPKIKRKEPINTGFIHSMPFMIYGIENKITTMIKLL